MPDPANQSEFAAVVEKTLAECQHILGTKGSDYTDHGNRYWQFRLIAQMLGITPYQVWGVFALKHMLRVTTAIHRNPEAPVTAGEPLEESIRDNINYELLLRGMLEDDTAKTNGEES
jgi:hypothetical protein